MRILVDLHNIRGTKRGNHGQHAVLHQPYAAPEALRAAGQLSSAVAAIWKSSPQSIVAHWRSGCALPASRFPRLVSLIDERSGRRCGWPIGVRSSTASMASRDAFRLMRRPFPRSQPSLSGRITNKTNGITFRRWLMLAIEADELLRQPAARPCWTIHQLRISRPTPATARSRRRSATSSITNKVYCAADRRTPRIKVDQARCSTSNQAHPEYKRQLLNILEAIALYHAIKGRSASQLGAAGENLRRQGGGELSLRQADHQLINDVAEVVNNDP